MDNFDIEAMGAITLFLREHDFITEQVAVDNAYEITVKYQHRVVQLAIARVIVLPPVVGLYKVYGEQVANYELVEPNFFDRLLADLDSLVRK
jgi:hypothetical protein